MKKTVLMLLKNLCLLFWFVDRQLGMV